LVSSVFKIIIFLELKQQREHKRQESFENANKKPKRKFNLSRFEVPEETCSNEENSNFFSESAKKSKFENPDVKVENPDVKVESNDGGYPESTKGENGQPKKNQQFKREPAVKAELDDEWW
jgi:hypothetical protein